MKKLQYNFTTPEQSKMLLDLGLPAWTADCDYYEEGYIPKDAYPNVVPPEEHYRDMSCQRGFSEYINLPSWSIGRLMEIYSICIKDDTDEHWPLHSSVESVGFTYMDHVINRFVTNKEIDYSKLEE